MAFFRGDIYSYELDKMTSMNVYLPHDDLARCQITKPMSTLILLHGLQGNNSFWTRYSSVERYAQEHNIALVIPEAEMSLYADMRCGLAYGRYIGEELKQIVQAMFRIPTDREHYGIAGFSMGGYGALRLALCYPEIFGKCMSICGAMALGSEAHLSELRVWRDPGQKAYYDPDEELMRTFRKSSVSAYGPELPCLPENDLSQLTRAAVQTQVSVPQILLTCGTEDFTYGDNCRYDALLTELGIPHQFYTWPGEHNWAFVDESVCQYLRFFAEQ